MKITISIFLVSFLILTSSWCQVTSVKYGLEYNEDTEYFEGKLIVLSGTATTIPQRIQFNAQFTVITPTGAELTLVESFMPLNSNHDYTGTDPLQWVVGSPIISPDQQPQSDFYRITPDLGITSHYNNLAPGDEIHLFNLSVTGDNVCEPNVRVFEHGIDPKTIWVADLSNGFTLGSINQIYSGNQYYTDSSDWEISIDDLAICSGECTTLKANLACAGPVEYLWSTEQNSPSIVVCPKATTTYQVTVTGIDGFTEVLESEVIVESLETPTISGPDEIAIGQFTQLNAFDNGTWTSEDNSIATINNNGLVTGISEGSVFFYFTSSSTGCTSEGVGPIKVSQSTVSTSSLIHNTVSLYPNPVSDYLLIDSPNKASSIVLFTKAGVQVLSRQIKNNRFDVSSIPDGLYFIKIQWPDGSSHVEKIAIK